MKVSKKDKKVLKWIAIIIGLILGWKILKKGLSQVSSFQNITFLNPKTPPQTISEGAAKALISRVFTDCEWFGSDSVVYSDLMALNDNDLVYTANIFATQFADENGGRTLQKYISDEKVVHSDSIDALLQRLTTLTAK